MSRETIGSATLLHTAVKRKSNSHAMVFRSWFAAEIMSGLQAVAEDGTGRRAVEPAAEGRGCATLRLFRSCAPATLPRDPRETFSWNDMEVAAARNEQKDFWRWEGRVESHAVHRFQHRRNTGSGECFWLESGSLLARRRVIRYEIFWGDGPNPPPV